VISGPFGGGPDEPGDEPADGTGPGGWIPPEARDWLHPSELHATLRLSALPAAAVWRRGAAIAVGSVAVTAIVVGLVLLANTGSGSPVARDMTVSTAAVTPCCRLPASLAARAERSVVSLESAGPKHTALGCGAVVNGGALVVTTSRALHGARRVQVVAATGELLAASVLAIDKVSGVALLRIPEALPPVAVGNSAELAAGSPAMAMAMVASTREQPRAVWTSGTVIATGAPAAGRPGSGMADITLSGPSVPDMPGEPLFDQRGQIVGILDSSWGSKRAFLPMSLVVGVSDDLVTMGRVRHGWLDVTETTATGVPGALVVSVEPQGAAASLLQAGDVIVAVNGRPVVSSAELRSMLYLLAPGTRVTLEAKRGTGMVKGVVELAASP
jgi:S1-C subfamily serine protease